MSINRDYIFNLNWEDNMKNIRKIGYFAKIENEYYLLISGEKNAEAAYSNGFAGLPGFKPDVVYKSQQLFDFFRNRVLDKKSEDPCAELAITKGESMIDSFSIEEISEILSDKSKQALIEAYKVQEELNELKNKNENENENENDKQRDA